jgi:hypothetical protein
LDAETRPQKSPPDTTNFGRDQKDPKQPLSHEPRYVPSYNAIPIAIRVHFGEILNDAGQSLAPNELIRLLIGSTVEEVERALVVQTLARYNGNVLGLSVRTLRNKIRVYIAEGIEVPAH